MLFSIEKSKILSIFLTLSIIFPQFIEINVTIDTNRIRKNEQNTFDILKNDISEYFLNNKFNESVIDLELSLDVHIIIESYLDSGSEKIVNSQIIISNQADQYYYAKGVDFPYHKGQSLSKTPFFEPLTSLLDYYANLFIATELDTYDYLGGDSYFVKSDQIGSYGCDSNYSRGWESRKKKLNELKHNRYLRAIRFHYFSIIDILDSGKKENKAIYTHLEQCIDNINSIIELYGENRNTSLFLDYYGEHLANLFKNYNLLNGIDKIRKLNSKNDSMYIKIINR